MSKKSNNYLRRVNQRQVDSLAKIFASKHRHRSSGVLKCLVDADDHKAAQKLYFKYISDSDFSKFPLFLQKFDRMLYKFGGKVAERPTEEEDEDLISRKRDKKGKDKKSKSEMADEAFE